MNLSNYESIDIEHNKPRLDGLIMELQDCGNPALVSIEYGFNPEEILKDVDVAVLIGGRPRSKGMERKDLLEANIHIFKEQGDALNKVGSKNVKVLVVANPANCNALCLQ